MIRIIADTIGDAGRLEVWPDTPDEQVTAWLDAAYDIDDALTHGHIDNDTAQDMRDAIEAVTAWATGATRDTPWETAQYLGLHLDITDEIQAVADAADTLDAAQDGFRATVLRAAANRAPKRKIVEAARISRPTLDRWIAEARK